MFRLVVVLAFLCYAAASEAKEDAKMFDGGKRAIEEKMAEWLAHPLEFGVKPKTVRFKRTYKATLITYGKVAIHLVDYVMPDGTRGRGFVNDGLTWSFVGPEIDSIKDDDLFVAYCGWAWLFPPLQKGSVQTEFPSSGEEAKYLAKKKQEGFTDIEVTGRYKIGSSELTEFKAKQKGISVSGAGDSQSEIVFAASDPRSGLPSIYFLLGQQVIQSVH
jgi:hypothetical protein